MAEPVTPPAEPRVPVRNNRTGKTGTIALSEYQSQRALDPELYTPLSREEHQKSKFIATQTDDTGEQILAGAEGALASGSMGLSDLWAASNMPADEFEAYKARRASDVSQNVETGTDIVTAVAGGIGGLGKATVGTAVKQGVKAEVKGAVRAGAKELTEEVVGAETKSLARSQAADALAAIAAETGNSPLGKSLSRRIVEGAGYIPSALGTRASGLAGEAVEAGLGRVGAPAALGKAAGLGAEGASEAARQRVSDNISEASLGGEDITAERLFAGVADDAMLWGGVGLGLGAVGGAIGAGRGALEHLVQKRAAAKALIPEAGVIDDARKVGFMPEEKVIEASAALSGHSPDQVRKLFKSPSLRIDHANQKAVKAELREQFRKAYDAAHEYAAVERSLLAGEFKAANVAKTVRRGPDVWPAAEQQVRAVTSGLLSQSDIVQREMVESYGKKEVDGLQRIARSAEARMRKAIKAGDEAEAYLTIEDLKRDLDGKAKDAEAAARRGGGDGGTEQIRQLGRLRDYAKEQATHVRRFLEDEATWGQAGRNQRLRNAAAHEMIGPSADMQARFMTELREGAEALPGDPNTFGSRKIAYADPAKIDSYLSSLNDPGRDVVHGQSARYFDAREKFLRTVLDNGEVPPELVGEFKDALAATQRARATINEATQRMADVNVMNEMLAKENAAAQAQLGALPSIGLGFATGGLRGGLAEAGNVITGRALSRPASIAARMAVVESMAQRSARVDQTVQSKVRAIARKAAHGVKRGADAAGKAGRVALRAAPAAYINTFGREPEDRRKSVEKRMKRILEMHDDPILSLRHGGEITRGMADSAPAVTAAVVRKHMTALDFIASKAKPAIETSGSMLQPHLTKRRYSDQQIRELAQMMTVVERPLSLLDDLETGNVNALQVETMQAVWPELFQDMRLKLMSELGATKTPLPYSSVVQLSLVLGIPGHPTMDPAFIQRQAERFAAEAEQRQQQVQNPTPPPSSTERMAAAEAGMNLADKIARSL